MAFVRTKGISAKRRERMEKALQMRKLGASYTEIGNNLGVSRATAHQDVTLALKEITREPSEELLALMNERLDMLWRATVDTALRKVPQDDHKGKQVQLKAIDSARGIVAEQARLNSLGADNSRSLNAIAETLDAQFELMERSLEELPAEG